MEKQENQNVTFNPGRILKSLASIKLTVVGLVILLLLVVWGTLYQTDHGLYQAQQKFFHSWFFLIAGFIPFPGAVLVMFVLFINLVLSIIYRIGFKLRNIGNLITHLGLIFLLVGSYFIYVGSIESTIVIQEGQEVNASLSRSMWEIALWRQQGVSNQVYAFDSNNLGGDDEIPIEDLGINIKIIEYYKNSQPQRGGGSTTSPVFNASGIKRLIQVPDHPQPGSNTAGCILQVSSGNQAPVNIILYGRDLGPTPVKTLNQVIYFSLRNKNLMLPFSLKLVDFKVVKYPNSNIPKSYESKVSLKTPDGLDRDVIISMNKPLRFDDITIFQSGYNTTRDGAEMSILAIVKSSARLFPYFSSLFIFLGLVIHFIAMLIRKNKRKQNE